MPTQCLPQIKKKQRRRRRGLPPRHALDGVAGAAAEREAALAGRGREEGWKVQGGPSARRLGYVDICSVSY